MNIVVFDTLPEEAKRIREEVFVQEQGFPKELDEIDDIAWHMVMFHEGEPIATCRIYESKEKGTFLLGRLAVRKPYRGKKYGSAMVREAMAFTLKNGGKEMLLHAQCRAKDFYRSLGFEERGEVEEEEGCPHIWMVKQL